MIFLLCKFFFTTVDLHTNSRDVNIKEKKKTQLIQWTQNISTYFLLDLMKLQTDLHFHFKIFGSM